MKRFYQIAIDGPAGSGKSTIAKLMAKRLGFLYIDSGAMYRAVTLYLLKNNLLKKSEHELKKHLKKIKINFLTKKEKQLIFLNNKNVTKKIRTQRVNILSAKSLLKKLFVKKW